MSRFLERWDDESRPEVKEALRDLLTRAIPPGIAMFAVIVGIGYLLKGPLKALGNDENALNRRLAAERDSLWNTITKVMSMVGNTEYVIGVCLILVALIWWRTRRWWYAVIPLIAISLQATIFVLATVAVGRERPPVSKLDPAPPTSSYPSGHVGASSALYFSLALMATRIHHTALRWAAIAWCVSMPFVVTFARLYRGMHHLTDVSVGMLNGIVCTVIAWLWLRRATSRDDTTDRQRVATTDRG